ncbi:ABC transporter permease [Agromyces aerolatus]|uniref:ABC transporter permease n=1 Tax=Agromyces sp. LY-1074 TaxID=3074080 RepID=UPI00285F8141|nr:MULTISPECIES: ABC transporter permease [unclassified Agromyces]MDR5700835.1 ABC transporter permease [Agromyces sp. LY-1074]MDR5707356.1 ABC transporter permease [Agromyces sp. LY-1358]
MIPDRRSDAMRLVGQRLVQLPLVLLIVSALVFALLRSAPGNPGRNALGPYATPEQVAAWNTAHDVGGGLFAEYAGWLGGFVTGDWGMSLVYGVPVRALVLERFVNSVLLGLLAFAILVPVSIGIASVQARVEGARVDRALTVVIMAIAAVPEFVVGVLLLIALAVVLPVLPVRAADGFGEGVLPQFGAMLLPAVTLALAWLAIVTRVARNGVIEASDSPFHRTAVVKGLRPGAVFRRHIARSALIPTVAVLGIALGTLLGGSAVVETLFGYPGLGELLVTATQRKDTAVLAAGVMVTGGTALLAVLAADLVVAMLDPRVRLRGAR